ncbi:MAG: rRNA maturation RNase YbeY [Pelosinus sp.]|nr:rRNA maturation RNase YbeY [Pelosinus sp.]
MEITISNTQNKVSEVETLEKIITQVLAKAAEVYGLDAHTEVSIVLSDDEYIHKLNYEYRGKDQPTDVLSFALSEGEEPEIIDGPTEVLLGDIIISVETAMRQAAEYGHSLEREMAYLTVHGILHLLGYDHMAEEEKQEMRTEEEHILGLLGIVRK